MKTKSEKMKKEKNNLTYTQLILMLLAKEPTNCLSLSELREKTQLDENNLHVYLHRRKERELIMAKWKKSENGKERIYCLKTKEILTD